MTYKSLSPRLVQSIYIYIYISELVNKSTYFNREGGCGGDQMGWSDKPWSPNLAK